VSLVADDAFSTPNRPPAPPRQPQPEVRLFEFLHGHDRYLVELRDHGAYGVKAQVWQNEEFSYSQRFETRALAVQWAEEERKFLVKGAG
jgi:hypothetical protein